MPGHGCLGGKIPAEGEEQSRCWMEGPLPIIAGASLLQTRNRDYSKALCSLDRGGQGGRGTASLTSLTSMVQSLTLSTSVGAEVNLDPFNAYLWWAMVFKTNSL